MADATNAAGKTRADEVRTERRRKPGATAHYGTERRRKPGATAHYGLKLGVDESRLDRKQYEYRWVNDAGNRVKQLEGNDWDIAPEQAAMLQDGVGTVQTKIVGTDAQGKPLSGFLMRKRKDWFDSDQKEKQKPLAEIDEQIRRGIHHTKDAAELGASAYTPDGGNTISR